MSTKEQERGEEKFSTDEIDAAIYRLARFIMDFVPGEPSRSESAMDVAVRLLAEHYPPSQPRVWSLPPEPGPEVTAVRSALPLYGFTLWVRDGSNWVLQRTDGVRLCWCPWLRLLEKFGPIVDATPPFSSTEETE